jgi:hypothetical protein
MARKRKARWKGCFAKVAKACARFARETGRKYRPCMAKALKRECYGGKRASSKRSRKRACPPGCKRR